MLVEGANGSNEGKAAMAPLQGVFVGDGKTSLPSGGIVSRSETEAIVPSAGIHDDASLGGVDGNSWPGASGGGSGLFPAGQVWKKEMCVQPVLFQSFVAPHSVSAVFPAVESSSLLLFFLFLFEFFFERVSIP